MSAPAEEPFAARVLEGMRRRGLSLRAFCRAARLDPSFVSKVLAGKRSPPSEEGALRRAAQALGVDPVGLIVAAGRIPSEWRGLWRDPELLRDVHQRATRSGSAASAPRRALRPAPAPEAARSRSSWSAPAPRPGELSEELL